MGDRESLAALRLPPHNLEAEMGVIGSALLDNEVLPDVTLAVAPDDFYRDAHRILAGAVWRMFEAGGRVDAVTLWEHLKARGECDRVGGMDYIGETIGSVPHAANALAYAQIVRQKAILRALIDGANATLRDCYSDAMTAEDAIAAAEARATSFGAFAAGGWSL
ncbi:MAG: hypothetical protein K2X91_15045 [Thermoleophilia bacterium]|nr:hypothetical protein [Thermoleophilia bacterium]